MRHERCFNRGCSYAGFITGTSSCGLSAIHWCAGRRPAQWHWVGCDHGCFPRRPGRWRKNRFKLRFTRCFCYGGCQFWASHGVGAVDHVKDRQRVRNGQRTSGRCNQMVDAPRHFMHGYYESEPHTGAYCLYSADHPATVGSDEPAEARSTPSGLCVNLRPSYHLYVDSRWFRFHLLK